MRSNTRQENVDIVHPAMDNGTKMEFHCIIEDLIDY